MALGYRIPKANQAMLISGGRTKKDEPPIAVVIGHGKFVLPGIRRAQYLDLSMREAIITERCYTKQGLLVGVKAVCAFKVADDHQSIVNAAQRFLDDQKGMDDRAGKIFAGHLRSIIGSMTLEEIVTERQKLADEVLNASEQEMGKLGLLVDSFQIESVDDLGQEYIKSMAAPHNARIKQQAAIAQAEATRAATEAEQVAVRKQAEYQRDTETTKAQYAAQVAAARAEAEQEQAIAQAKAQQATNVAQANATKETQVARARTEQETNVAQAQAEQAAKVARAKAAAEINREQAEAEQAGPLTRAIRAQEVAVKETALAEQEAELAEQRLLATKVKPAEAEKKARVAQAEAEATAQKLQAEAAASAGRVQLDQLLIEQLPDVAQAIASGLSGADLTILNGTTGLTEVVTNLAGQALSVYDVIKEVRNKHVVQGEESDNLPVPSR